jgi:hypothetical protein
MKHTCVYSQTLGRVALLVVMAAFSVSSMAQDLQVMVSGPWSYVVDQVNYPGRLLLVAPGKSAHHQVYMLAGTDPKVPKKPNTPTAYAKGTYKLNYQAQSAPYTTPDQDPPVLSGGAITDTADNVKPILDNANAANYVISLPTPNGYTTYSGSMGSSESEISGAHIKANSVSPRKYTTLMVLHYGVTKIPDFFQLADGTTISTKGASPATSGGISIVLGEDPNMAVDNLPCDTVSLESVEERNGVWPLTQYARFPEQSISGIQVPGKYDYKHCSDSDPSKPPRQNKTAGSADCHGPQMSINSAVTGAIVPVTVVSH